MELKTILSTIKEISSENNLSTAYVVGGIPRDIILDKLNSVNDIDITTGNNDVHRLGDLFADKIGGRLKVLDDGHRKVMIGDYSVDFSSNLTYDNIDDILKNKNIEITDLNREAFSRDFTINSILMDLDLDNFYDPTRMGIEDAKAGLLRCPVSPELSLVFSPNRIIRAFFYAAKYGLKMDPELKEAIRKNLNLLDDVNAQYAMEKLGKALEYDNDLLDDLLELGVINKFPLSKKITDILIKEKKLKDAL